MIRPKTFIGFVMLCLIAIGGPAGPFRLEARPVPEMFRYSAVLEGTSTANIPVRVELPASLVAHTENRLQDLRVFDDSGNETPFVLYDERWPTRAPRTFSFQIVNYETTDGQDTVVLQTPDSVTSFNGVEIRTRARDFKRKVEIFAGDDLTQWKPVKTDIIFDYSTRIDFRKTLIEFPSTQARYLKILVRQDKPNGENEKIVRFHLGDRVVELDDGESHDFRVDGVQGLIGSHRKETVHCNHLSITSPRQSTDVNGTTIVDLGRVNLPADSVTIDVSDTFYYRTLEVESTETLQERTFSRVGQGTVYRIPGMASGENRVGVNAPWVFRLRLRIHNGDNPPLKVRKVDLAWVKQSVFFFPEEGKNYRIYCGNAQIREAKYDVAKLIPRECIRREHFQTLLVGEVEENPTYAPGLSVSTREKLQQTLLVGLVLVMASVIGFWLFQLVRKIPTP